MLQKVSCEKEAEGGCDRCILGMMFSVRIDFNSLAEGSLYAVSLDGSIAIELSGIK